MTNPLIDSLMSIIEQRPEDHALREHLAELLIAEGRSAEAVSHLAVVLAVDPHNERVSALMRSARPSTGRLTLNLQLQLPPRTRPTPSPRPRSPLRLRPPPLPRTTQAFPRS